MGQTLSYKTHNLYLASRWYEPVDTRGRATVKSTSRKSRWIGPLHDPVTWYKITYTGEQVTQWDFQNKGRCIVLEAPLCNLLTSICNFVPCDRVVQRAYTTTLIGPMHDPVTWYGINYAWTQITQWDFQNQGTLTSPARISFVFKVLLRYLLSSKF